MTSVVSNATLHVDRSVGQVLDFLERSWFPSQPQLQNPSIDRDEGTAGAIAASGGSIGMLSIDVKPSGAGSQVEVLILLETSYFRAKLVRRDLDATASEFASSIAAGVAATT